MEGFSIEGTDGHLKITFAEVYTLPEGTCALGGHEVRAALEICSGGSQIKVDLFTATGEIYAFFEELKLRNVALTGGAHFRTYENKLELQVAYDNPDQIKVSGSFSQKQEAAKLEFAFHTDQTSIRSTLSELKVIADKYGDRRGRKIRTAN